MSVRVVEKSLGCWTVKEIGCAVHPIYKAIQAPRSTVKHPRGCATCWEVFARKAASDYRNRRRKEEL